MGNSPWGHKELDTTEPLSTASESFPMSQLFASGGQSTGVSALASFLPGNSDFIQEVSRLMAY